MVNIERLVRKRKKMGAIWVYDGLMFPEWIFQMMIVKDWVEVLGIWKRFSRGKF